ncbi:MAG: ankyrin repeat domain-containing protein [Acidobacteriota bacterium]|nr:ankyrin repeat domain-containing protein [Acidobacteriota bacterium]
MLLPILVVVGLYVLLATLPKVFPDRDAVSDAIAAGDVERVRELLDRGVDPNSQWAVVSPLAKGLSRTGYSSDAKFDFSIRAPLLIDALNHRQFAIARLLLERGADPNLSDEFGQSALARARDMEAPPPLVALLLQKGAR